MAAQLAAAVVLLSGAAGLTRSAWNLANRELGFEPERLLTFGVVLPREPWAHRPGEALALHGRLSGVLHDVPGVDGVAYGVGVPGAHVGWMRPFEVSAPSAPEVVAAHRYRRVSREYLEVLGIPVLVGRGFSPTDFQGPDRAVVVNESLARMYWGGPEAALGESLREVTDSTWVRVVGVVGNTADAGPGGEVLPMVYLPLLAEDAGDGAFRFVQYAIRGEVGAAELERPVLQALDSLAPGVPAFGLETGVESLRRTTTAERLALKLLTAGAGGAVLTLMLGLGGLVLMSLLRRKWELGVRKTLGASNLRLRLEALRPLVGPLLAGAALGAALVVAGLRVPSDLLFGAGPWTLHLWAAFGLLLPVVAGAVLVGTRYIIHVAPAVALRAD